MKKLELYQCEICGTQFSSKLQCEQCEKSHVKLLEIEDTRYVRDSCSAKNYPVTITVTMEDGKTLIYKR